MFKTTQVTPRTDGRIELTKLVKDNIGTYGTIYVKREKRGKLLSIHRDRTDTIRKTGEVMWSNVEDRFFYTPGIRMDTYNIQVTNKYIHVW